MLLLLYLYVVHFFHILHNIIIINQRRRLKNRVKVTLWCCFVSVNDIYSKYAKIETHKFMMMMLLFTFTITTMCNIYTKKKGKTNRTFFYLHPTKCSGSTVSWWYTFYILIEPIFTLDRNFYWNHIIIYYCLLTVVCASKIS